jgi:catechol 2,3-dioxygenase-like lactoylglutathione lyase family enzyme
MISHVHLGTNDLERAERFYSPLLRLLDWQQRFVDHESGWAGWQPANSDRPLFLVGKAHDGHAASPGNGQMVALLAGSRSTVDEVHSAALTAGATNEGNPGLRPNYHAHYYGAYFRDLDGNKICVCCHGAE